MGGGGKSRSYRKWGGGGSKSSSYWKGQGGGGVTYRKGANWMNRAAGQCWHCVVWSKDSFYTALTQRSFYTALNTAQFLHSSYTAQFFTQLLHSADGFYTVLTQRSFYTAQFLHSSYTAHLFTLHAFPSSAKRCLTYLAFLLQGVSPPAACWLAIRKPCLCSVPWGVCVIVECFLFLFSPFLPG